MLTEWHTGRAYSAMDPKNLAPLPPRWFGRALSLTLGILLAATFCACADVSGKGAGASTVSTPVPDLRLAGHVCPLQTAELLGSSQLPPHLTPQGPPSRLLGVIGPYHDLSGGPVYPGSLGEVAEYFQWNGFPSHPVQDIPADGSLYIDDPTQVFQFAEEIDDWGTLVNADRWMATQHASNHANDMPDYGNGVERIPPVPHLGDDTFMYQIDDGAAYGSTPHTGPFVGHIFTDLEVRDGDVMFALGLDTGPGADSETLAVSIMRDLIAKARAVCG